MARALLVVNRCGNGDGLQHYVNLLNRRLTPDNLIVGKPTIVRRHGVTTVIFNPADSILSRSGSVCLGALFGTSRDWHRPGAARPEGCYALLRSDARHVELVADAAASRTVWYILTPERFIASTSQRAIVSLLGRFEPNPSAAAWMLSSGTLGPGAGWDARLRQVLPDERVSLDRAHWRLTHEVLPTQFHSHAPEDRAAHVRNVTEAVESVCERFVFDTSRWVFLLSGGVDSRGLLSLLAPREGLRTITWGVSAAPHQAWNDARIAHDVARKLGIENRFFSTDLAEESRECLIRRFLVAGEGRVANISPFLDGFALWKTLREEGIDGIVRGDQAFGARYLRTPREVRVAGKLTMLEDYFDKAQIEAFGLPEQALPPRLMRRQAETLITWRDRLYQENRLPKFLAGLSDLKTGYVEVVNPLLTQSVLQCVRALPDELRTGKRLWKEIARARGVSTPLARRVAVMPLQTFLSDTAMLRSMLAEMATMQDGDLLAPSLRANVCELIQAALAVRVDRRSRVASPNGLSLIVPDRIRDVARRWVGLKVEFDPIVFAFRAFIVSKMGELLRADAAALSAEPRYVAGL